MHILITGSAGMLWTTLRMSQIFEQAGHTMIYTDIGTFDITSSQISYYLATHTVDMIINCAAYTDVDNAEDAWRIANYEINTLALASLVHALHGTSIKLLHISTDYVFDGSKKEWNLTDDLVWPLNHYGISKRLGEQLILRNYPHAKVIRTSRLYGGGWQFKNFVHTMLKLSETKKELSIIDDQRWAPTYTGDLVDACLQLTNNRDSMIEKIYHCCNQTPAWWITRCRFACEIFTLTQKNITLTPITSAQYPTKATRPLHSWMISSPLLQLPERTQSLRRYLSTL